MYDSIEKELSIGVVPTIVLAELMHISERGRIRLGFDEVMGGLQDSHHFEIAALDSDVLSHMIVASGLELHDRVIVATALSLGATLLTQDREVRDAGLVEPRAGRGSQGVEVNFPPFTVNWGEEIALSPPRFFFWR